MAGYRSRSRSRSYSPPHRRYSRSPPRHQRYDDPRDRYRGGGGGGGGGGPRRGYGRPPAPTGLLVRNISLTARLEDIRIRFEQFGPVKDVYLPRNFHTRWWSGGLLRILASAAQQQEESPPHPGDGAVHACFLQESCPHPIHMLHLPGMAIGRYMDGSHRRRSEPRSPRSRYYCKYTSLDRDRRDEYSPGGSYSPHSRDKRHNSLRHQLAVWSTWIKSWEHANYTTEDAILPRIDKQVLQ
ncbi:hypothetical protein ABZP36_006675 [Zizania latifolia]